MSAKTAFLAKMYRRQKYSPVTLGSKAKSISVEIKFSQGKQFGSLQQQYDKTMDLLVKVYESAKREELQAKIEELERLIREGQA